MTSFLAARSTPVYVYNACTTDRTKRQISASSRAVLSRHDDHFRWLIFQRSLRLLLRRCNTASAANCPTSVPSSACVRLHCTTIMHVHSEQFLINILLLETREKRRTSLIFAQTKQLHYVSKNDTALICYNFDLHQPNVTETAGSHSAGASLTSGGKQREF